jgi:hypothetical protein
MQYSIKSSLSSNDATKHQLFICFCPRIYECSLAHFYPFFLVNANEIAAFAFDFVAIMNTKVFYYSLFPAV